MNIIITGCTRGIGRQLVDVFLQNQLHKVIGMARNAETLRALESQYGLERFKGICVDVTDIDASDKPLLGDIKKHFNHVDVLVNNAGLLLSENFESYTSAAIEKMFRTNVIAPFDLIRMLMPLLQASGRAHVVNIGSMGGFQGSSKYKGLLWYSSSKAALACATECLAEELKGTSVSVNCLALGAAQTEMLNEAFPGYTAPVSAAQMAQYVAHFAETAGVVMSGKIVPVAFSNP